MTMQTFWNAIAAARGKSKFAKLPVRLHRLTQCIRTSCWESFETVAEAWSVSNLRLYCYGLVLTPPNAASFLILTRWSFGIWLHGILCSCEPFLLRWQVFQPPTITWCASDPSFLKSGTSVAMGTQVARNSVRTFLVQCPLPSYQCTPTTRCLKCPKRSPTAPAPTIRLFYL